MERPHQDASWKVRIQRYVATDTNPAGDSIFEWLAGPMHEGVVTTSVQYPFARTERQRSKQCLPLRNHVRSHVHCFYAS